MKRGRPRKYDPTIPPHIDQRKLPPGLYWDARDRVWYTVRRGSDGKAKRRRLAGAHAKLSELCRISAELAQTDDDAARGTIAWLHGRFKLHADWRALTPATQRDYCNCIRALAKLPTALKITADQLAVNRLRRVDVQRLVDVIAETRPSTANHVARYLSRLFAWGMQRGEIEDRDNPAHDVQHATERARNGMPSRDVMERVIQRARQCGALPPRTPHSCPPYLWILMRLAYLCRLRGVEVLMLTDADKLEEGIYCRRRKGSLDTITHWNGALQEAWAEAEAIRREALARNARPVPMHAKDRPLLVSAKGLPLVKLDAAGNPVTRSAVDTAWQRFMGQTVRAGVLAADQRFTLHGLKHRGITDTVGGKAAKKISAGHVTDSMTNRYDHEIPVVEPAGMVKK